MAKTYDNKVPVNLFIEDPTDTDEAKRIGKRIRKVRQTKGMSQSELGAKLNLTADRIQKYENGARKAKDDLLKSIADALGVSIYSLTDPIVCSEIGMMYGLFEMAEIYNIVPQEINGEYYIKVTSQNTSASLSNLFKLWLDEFNKKELLLNSSLSDEENSTIIQSYLNFLWNFPNISASKEAQKERLTKIILAYQQELDNL